MKRSKGRHGLIGMTRSDLIWRIGTIGFSYSEWRGVFYPAHVKPAAYLSWYSAHFDSVELDTTFHALPAPQRVRAWGQQVDDSFRFALKAPRMITHEEGLDQKEPLLRLFLETAAELGDKLGIVLLQFPSTFDLSRLGSLLKLLDAARPAVPIAVEFRHRTWFEQGAVQLLADRGITIVAHDYLEKAQPIVPAATLYIRLIGEHDRFPSKNCEESDVEDRLAWWVRQIEQRAPQRGTIWVTANNDYAGYSIGTVTRLRRMLGLSTEPRMEHPARSLFD